MVAEHIPGLADYLATMAARPHVQQVANDRDAAIKAFFEKK
jgi:hypothetical protein